jgi:chaperonin GroEL
MSKTILHGAEAQKLILNGVNFLADAVKITEGPRGRNVLLGQRALGQSPKVTRDGVTVSNYADPGDPTEQMGADLVREAAQKTDNAVGDGTTASIVLAQAMIRSGFDLINSGANPMAMERGIHKATEAIIAQLRRSAVRVTDQTKLQQVATVSAHGDVEIGKLVAEAVTKAGIDGVVTAEPSSTSDTYVESVPGLELPKSNLIHPAFITHPQDMKAEYLDCRILLWEGVIATARSIVPILEQVNKAAGAMPLIIIAGGYESEALACIIKNKAQLALPLIAVRMDAYGERRKELMRDIAALTGGKAFTEDMGTKIENVIVKDLGQARKVITDMSKTQIIQGKGNQTELEGRVNLIRQSIETASPAEKTILKHRLAALTGGITVIKVGGVTVTQMEETKDRVVDALSAAKAAVEQGIVAGGGSALFHAAVVLKKFDNSAEHAGIEVVRRACGSVVYQIATNAGLSLLAIGDIIDTLAASPDYGYNAYTDQFENLIETGIVDPVKVVIESLKNASAVSCSILTMGATVAEILQEKKNG